MISIRKDNKQRINAFAAYTDEAGTRYPTVPPEVFEWVEPPAPPADYVANPVNYNVTEVDAAPYVVYTRKSEGQIATARWTTIKALRDAKTQSGGYKVGSKWYHSDTFSRTQQMGLVMMGTAMPAGLQWKTLDGSFVAMTPTLAQQIFAAAALQDAALFAHAEYLKNNPSQDIYTGWPETFSSGS